VTREEFARLLAHSGLTVVEEGTPKLCVARVPNLSEMLMRNPDEPWNAEPTIIEIPAERVRAMTSTRLLERDFVQSEYLRRIYDSQELQSKLKRAAAVKLLMKLVLGDYTAVAPSTAVLDCDEVVSSMLDSNELIYYFVARAEVVAYRSPLPLRIE